MKTSFRLGRLRGIELKIHFTFFLLLAWILVSALLSGGTMLGASTALLLVLSVIVCVALHEFGHALAARFYGIATRDIVLLPIGGVARLERIPERPREEFWIALAGPMVNFAIALGLMSSVWVTGRGIEWAGIEAAPFLEKLIAVNVFLALFNLLPAFPMDGGRILRAALATKRPYHVATRWASYGGRAFAIAFFALGLFGNIFLAVIGLFLWFAAGQEAKRAELKALLGHVPVSRVMRDDVPMVRSTDNSKTALAMAMAGPADLLPVVDDGQFAGSVSVQKLVSASPESTVGELAEPTTKSLLPETPLDESLDAFLASDIGVMPVVSRTGIVTGTLSLRRVLRYYELARGESSGIPLQTLQRRSETPRGERQGERDFAAA